MTNGSCKLCGVVTKLHNSHIIPNFFYKRMEDEKGNRNRYLAFGRHVKMHHRQGGTKEKLLCVDCEREFSVYEKYVREVLYGGFVQDIKIEQINKRMIKVNNVDYNKMKLFQLSILWRASVSNHDFFSGVNLGPHEDRIHDMLINKNPGKADDYPCLILRIIDDKKKTLGDMIIDPTWNKYENHKSYQFIFGCFAWIYFVSSHKKPMEITKLCLNPKGHFHIYDFEFSKMGKVVDLFKNVLQ